MHWQAIEVNKGAHAGLKGQRPCAVWFTGLSGAGKSTIANIVERKLHERGRHTYLLDGDNVRHGLNKDLGFTVADRVENIRRVAEVVNILVDAGLIVVASFISPFHAERQMVREHLDDGEFIEVYVDASLEVAERTSLVSTHLTKHPRTRRSIWTRRYFRPRKPQTSFSSISAGSE